MQNTDFLKARFGIEIEMTGITRSKASKVAAEVLGGSIERENDSYDTYKIIAPDERTWKIMYDGSIYTQKTVNGEKVTAGKEYSVELVSPILTYKEDIDTLQEIIRGLKKAGGFANSTVGVHLHLDGADHTPRSIRNFINIIYSRNDLLYESLQIEPNRMRYCKKMDADLVDRMNKKKPTTMKQIEDIWYEGYGSNRDRKYHESRYHFFYAKHHIMQSCTNKCCKNKHLLAQHSS